LSSAVPMRGAEVLAAEGRMDESVESECRQFLLEGRSAGDVEELRQAYRTGGLRALRAKEIVQFREQFRTGVNWSFGIGTASHLATAFAQLGDREETLHWLTIGVDQHEDVVFDMRTTHHFDLLKNDPRFAALVHRVWPDGQ